MQRVNSLAYSLKRGFGVNLVLNMDYRYDIKNNGSDDSHVYDALILKNGVCHDCSAAYTLLCHEVGLKCMGIQSPTHAWNIVKINGNWYNADCTWDDPVGGGPRYDYFLISDEQIERIGLPIIKGQNGMKTGPNVQLITNPQFDNTKDLFLYEFNGT